MRRKWRREAIDVNAWSYLPHTEEDRRAMLEAIGVKSTEALFVDIPAEVRMKRPLNLPPAFSEMELKSHIQELALQDRDFEESLYFLGAGAYDHYVPSVVIDKAEDPTGCGNSSTATAMYAFCEGYAPYEIAVMANVTAAYNLRQYGLIPEFSDEIRAQARERFRQLCQRYQA